MRPKTSTSTMAVLLSVLLAITGCTPHQEEGDDATSKDPSLIGWSQRDIAVASVLEEAPCENARLFQGDPYFQDEMYGFGCYDANGVPLHFRIYQNEGSAQNVVAEWKGLITPEYQVEVGADWFAIGAPNTLKQLAGVSQLEYAELFSEAPPVSSPVSESEMKQQVCISYVSSAVEVAAGHATAPKDVQQLDQMYPEMSTLILDVYDEVQSDLGSRAPDSMDVLAVISTHWARISDYCERASQGVHIIDEG